MVKKLARKKLNMIEYNHKTINLKWGSKVEKVNCHYHYFSNHFYGNDGS